jgi:hypothetical protein
MVANVSCASPGCLNPVIGQCTGYKIHCQRFYCQQHSVGKLCGLCGSQKKADDDAVQLEIDYTNLIKGIQQEAKDAYNGKKMFLKGLKITAIIGFFAGPIAAIFAPKGTDLFQLIIAAPIDFIMIYLLGGSILGKPILWLLRENWMNKNSFKRAEEINKSHPGFLGYFQNWHTTLVNERKQTAKETVVALGTFAAAIAVAAAISVAEDEKERVHEQRIEDAVRRGMRDR